MAFSYVRCDRDQGFLLPPDLREWLPAGHLAHLIVEVVDAIDTSLLHVRHPNDGQGRPAYDPDMLLALTLYCACQKVESSRRVEQLCEVDVACRYICANLVPDHATIARFLRENQDAFALIFAETLRLCAEAGMVKVGVVALDGTKIAANASLQANAGRDRLEAEAKSIVEAIVAADAGDDARLGEARGDELPAELTDRNRRRDRLARLERCLEIVAEREVTSKAARGRQRRWGEAAEGRKSRGRPARPGSDVAIDQAQAALAAARVKAEQGAGAAPRRSKQRPVRAASWRVLDRISIVMSAAPRPRWSEPTSSVRCSDGPRLAPRRRRRRTSPTRTVGS